MEIKAQLILLLEPKQFTVRLFCAAESVVTKIHITQACQNIGASLSRVIVHLSNT
jgi:hypothetical protein